MSDFKDEKHERESRPLTKYAFGYDLPENYAQCVERLKPVELAHANFTRIPIPVHVGPCQIESSELFVALDYMDQSKIDELLPTVLDNRVALRLEIEFVIKLCLLHSRSTGGEITRRTDDILDQTIEDLVNSSSSSEGSLGDEMPTLDHCTWAGLGWLKREYVDNVCDDFQKWNRKWRKLRVIRDLICIVGIQDDRLASYVTRFLSPAECLVAARISHLDMNDSLQQDKLVHVLLLKGIWGISPGFSELVPRDWEDYVKLAVSSFVGPPNALHMRIPIFDGDSQNVPTCFREAKECLVDQLLKCGLMVALAKIVCLFMGI